METFICAFGTDDGIDFTNRHFGDSNRFDIYKIDEKTVTFVKQIDNNSEEEKEHADANKAKSIAQILKAQGVQVVFAKRFGPNIIRIKKKFVCIKATNLNISEMQKITVNNISLLNDFYKKGEERGYIVETNSILKIVNLNNKNI